MYRQTMINNLKTIDKNLRQLDGQGKTYELLQKVMQEVDANQKAFGVLYWLPEDIEQLLADDGLTLEASEILEIAESADKRLRETMTEAGWDTLSYFIDDYLSPKK